MDNHENPIPGKTYISPSLRSDDDPRRTIRIATKLIEAPNSYAFAKIRDEIVLRHKPDSKTKIVAKFFEDDCNLFALNIQGVTVATEKPHNASFSFVGNEIDKLIEFLRNIETKKFKENGYQNITDDELAKIALTDAQATNLGRVDKHNRFVNHCLAMT